MEWWQDIYNRQLYFDLYEEEDTAIAPKQVEQLMALLDMRSPAKILDLCCGYGRHSIELARKGFEVVGVDISEKQVQHARERADRVEVKVDFRVGDARALEFRSEFDFVINMFVSFGFFQSRDEDAAMLESVFRALKPTGRFLMDFWNREREIRGFQPTYFERIRDVLILKEWEFDHLEGRLNWKNTALFPDGGREMFEHSVRAYTVAELKELLETVGLKVESVYGSLSGEEFTLDSPAAILEAVRPE